MARKLALIILIHECDEELCHLDNASQEGWLAEQIQSNKRIAWNWKLHRVRVVDLIGKEQPLPWSVFDEDESP